MKIILSIDESKSTGPSSIPVRLLKTAAPDIILPLCKLINISFHTGVFPDSIKVAKVVPTFKSGSSQDINNYIPISLLSVFSKIIEKLCTTDCIFFLQEHDIIYKSRYGFQRNKSTLHSIIQIVEKIRNSIENKTYGCGIFINLKKAFDTVNHKILLDKLEHYGIRGYVIMLSFMLSCYYVIILLSLCYHLCYHLCHHVIIMLSFMLSLLSCYQLCCQDCLGLGFQRIRK